jgi:hypothetical protein
MIGASRVFPPHEVANFLVEVFFEFAQTNYSYVHEQSLCQRLDRFYFDTTPLDTEDASWLCTLLMIFAIGTQFAHLSSRQIKDNGSKSSSGGPDTPASQDDETALKFYHAAITLIADIISLPSIEGVQAFLLLGVYTLPIDAAGLSYTYFGIAIKLAIQNGMHRKFNKGMDAQSIELRNRVWWTTYTIERYQPDHVRQCK